MSRVNKASVFEVGDFTRELFDEFLVVGGPDECQTLLMVKMV
jgi:hypothetical protein